MRPHHLLALLLMAAPAPSAFAASADTGVISKDGVDVIILHSVAPASGPESLIEAPVDVEARTDDAARRLGFRSLRGATTVDCRQGANRLTEAVAYDQADLKGAPRTLSVSGAWVHPTPDSYMATVTERICAAAAPVSAKPAMVITAASSVEAPTPPPPPAATAALVIASPAPPAPPPASSVPARVTIVAMARVNSARPRSLAVAQVAASPTDGEARRVLGALHSMIVSPLAGSVEPALVGGAKVYRASVAGFASQAEAKAFCVRAAGIAKTCWVRLSTPPKSGKRA